MTSPVIGYHDNHYLQGLPNDVHTTTVVTSPPLLVFIINYNINSENVRLNAFYLTHNHFTLQFTTLTGFQLLISNFWCKPFTFLLKPKIIILFNRWTICISRNKKHAIQWKSLSA